MYVKSRETAITVVHMCTRVDIVQRKNKTRNKISTERHRWELLGNHPVFTRVMVM